MRGTMLAAALLAAAGPLPGRALDRGPIQDNSFLVEEAYNQEPGVIQHISTFARGAGSAGWQYTFTEEWPIQGLAHGIVRVPDHAVIHRHPAIPHPARRCSPRGQPEFGEGPRHAMALAGLVAGGLTHCCAWNRRGDCGVPAASQAMSSSCSWAPR